MCEKPKGNQNSLECHKCMINTHIKCLVVDKQKLDNYKKKIDVYECYECYRGLPSNVHVKLNNADAIAPIIGEPIVIDDEEFQCDSCEFKTKEVNLLRNHKSSGHNVGQFKCKECDTECISQSELESHLISTHGENVNQHLKEKCDFLEEEIAKKEVSMIKTKSC